MRDVAVITEWELLTNHGFNDLSRSITHCCQSIKAAVELYLNFMSLEDLLQSFPSCSGFNFNYSLGTGLFFTCLEKTFSLPEK